MARIIVVIAIMVAQFFSTTIAKKNEAVKKRDEDIRAIVKEAKGAYFRNLIIGIIINGWRPYFNNIIWLKISTNEDENRYIDNKPLLKILTALSPEYEEVWSHHGWNLAINISRTVEDVEKSWLWIKEGLKTIKEGLKFNPNSENLLTWYALILYNRALYEPIYEDKFLRDFKESPYRMAAYIYNEISEKKREKYPDMMHYEGFVDTMLLYDIFFQLRVNNFVEARKSILELKRYSLQLVSRFRKYNITFYLKRAFLASILKPVIKAEKVAYKTNNNRMRIRLINKYLKLAKIFYKLGTFEILKNRITVLLSTILNDTVYNNYNIDYKNIEKILDGLKNVFNKHSQEGSNPGWKRVWEVHKEFIEDNINIVKYEKEGKINEAKEKVQEIEKKYPIYKFLNTKKYIR